MFKDSESWADWMVIQPSIEQEFKLESEAQAIRADDEHEEIAELCARLSKQNWYQQELIKQATQHIMELEARIACLDLVDEVIKKESRPWWRAMFSGDFSGGV